MVLSISPCRLASHANIPKRQRPRWLRALHTPILLNKADGIVADTAQLPDTNDRTVFSRCDSVNGGIIFPVFVNTHTHTYTHKDTFSDPRENSGAPLLTGRVVITWVYLLENYTLVLRQKKVCVCTLRK